MFKPQPLIFDPKVSASLLLPAPHHNYAVGGDLVNAFAVGPVGSDDDFWFVALEPPTTDAAEAGPLICANLFDAFGRRLLTLDHNEPIHNPRGCRIERGPGEFLVTDPHGRDLCRVETREVRAAGCRVSYIRALFKDRSGAVRLESRGPVGSPSLVLQGRYAVGLRADDTVAVNRGLSEGEVAALAALAHRG